MLGDQLYQFPTAIEREVHTPEGAEPVAACCAFVRRQKRRVVYVWNRQARTFNQVFGTDFLGGAER